MRSQVRRGWTAGSATPMWVSLAYSTVWTLSLLAAGRAFLGAGGLKVALLALIPIVLLAPPALDGIRTLLGRRPERRAEGPGEDPELLGPGDPEHGRTASDSGPRG
jgi:hypothetical protein